MNAERPHNEVLFSVTRDDFEWAYFRSGGKGGQNQNKRDTGVRCTHRPSGVVAESREFRTQLENKRAAWRKVIKSVRFQSWLFQAREEAMGRPSAEEVLRKSFTPKSLRLETRSGGRWVVADEGITAEDCAAALEGAQR